MGEVAAIDTHWREVARGTDAATEGHDRCDSLLKEADDRVEHHESDRRVASARKPHQHSSLDGCEGRTVTAS